MPLLALDTSAAISIALLNDDGEALNDDGAVLAIADKPERRRHAEDLMPLITQLLGSAGLRTKDLTAVAVGTGPGPFTGLRIGLVTAQTLGFALGIPVYGVSSLEALATEAAQMHHSAEAQVVIATLDARRKEIFWAGYQVGDSRSTSANGLLRLVIPPAVGKAAQLAEFLATGSGEGESEGFDSGVNALVVGEGAELYREQLAGAVASSSSFEPLLPGASLLGRIAQRKARAGIRQPTAPQYLRRPDIHGQ